MDQRKGYMIAAHLEKRKLLIAINSVAALSIFFFGYDQGMMGGVSSSFDYVETMGFGYIENGVVKVTNTLLQGGIVSVYYLGTLLGCLMGGSFGDRYGRIYTIALGSVWGLIGATIQTSAMNSKWMICARLVNGIGTGILNAIVPAWASEVAEYTTRGKFIAIEFTLNIFGVVVAYWLAYGVSFIDGGWSPVRWRLPIGFQIIPLLVLLAICWFFPESPRWLCKVDRDDEALYILKRLRGAEGEDAGKAQLELSDIRNIVELEKATTHGNTYYHMFFGIGSGKLHTSRRVQLCIWLQILQDWSGIAGITMFGPTIFGIAGFTTEKAQWISGLNNIFYMFATLICVYTLDRIGRRWTLWWGAAGQAIAMFLVGGFCRLGLNAHASGDISAASKWGAAAASMVFLYTFIFGATWLTVPWLYPAEIFLSRSGQKATLGVLLAGVTLTLILPYIVSAINEKLLYIFGACNIISIPIVWAFYPESNQRTLEEMDMLFASDSPWVWDAEANFKLLKEQNPNNLGVRSKDLADMDIEAKMASEHVETH